MSPVNNSVYLAGARTGNPEILPLKAQELPHSCQDGGLGQRWGLDLGVGQRGDGVTGGQRKGHICFTGWDTGAQSLGDLSSGGRRLSGRARVVSNPVHPLPTPGPGL